ncbi:MULTISPECIES: TetR/AcrR family transcriptional regulator [unclassified Curtobacterium]|uniref:TetR/AcrR family transcriptional regulator n=1 Tax=unclassified Curtobacterium TaxID=257496 RepID=UPI0008DCD7F5|nr:TetR/AcrR family transcriptional regulator [Curtobacterium sp. MCBA15_016]OII21732.1 hypothetical protein BIV03_14600 [Curtobacterium sp. MCBA15_016]
MNQRQEQRARTRQRIIEAAAQEFARNGYAGTSFSSIAASMGKPKSSIGYEAFPSKQALANAVVEQHLDRLEALLGRVERTMRPGLDALLIAMRAGLHLDRTSPIASGALRLMIEQSGEQRPSRVEHALDFVRRNVRAAIEDGDVPATVDAGVLARRLLTGALGAHAANLFRLSGTPVDQSVQTSWEIVLRDAGASPERIRTLAAYPLDAILA